MVGLAAWRCDGSLADDPGARQGLYPSPFPTERGGGGLIGWGRVGAKRECGPASDRLRKVNADAPTGPGRAFWLTLLLQKAFRMA